jgi:hypothetical protein
MENSQLSEEIMHNFLEKWEIFPSGGLLILEVPQIFRNVYILERGNELRKYNKVEGVKILIILFQPKLDGKKE